MISAIGSVGAGMPAAPATPAAQVAGASAPGAQQGTCPVSKSDSISISDKGKMFLDAELLGTALIIALLSKPEKKEDESSLLMQLAVTAMVLQSLARLSPFISIENNGSGNVYSLSGSIEGAAQAAASSNIASMFTGGVGAMATACAV